MKMLTTSFTLSTEERFEVSDITKIVRDAIQAFAITSGIALVKLPDHGTTQLSDVFETTCETDYDPIGIVVLPLEVSIPVRA